MSAPKTTFVNNFSNGMVNDIYNGGVGQFSNTKHFDILTYGNRLVPLRGMATDTASTGIGNIIVSSVNGLMYGSGNGGGNSGSNATLWQRTGYGGSDGWVALWNSHNQYANSTVANSLLVDWASAGNIQTLIWSSASYLNSSAPDGSNNQPTRQSLTFSTIGQGLEHPADKILYFPYSTTSASYVGSVSPDATPFNTHAFTALTLPVQYRAYCLSYYGNYLAIPGATTNVSGTNSSRVFFWGRDTTQSWDYDIAWGDGTLQVLNNLNGALIGISSISDPNISNDIQDQVNIEIKEYTGGQPVLVQRITANHLSSTGAPSVTVNPNVNFVHANRLYFSVTINPNDGISNSYQGLWSIGKNTAGHYVVTIERMATNIGTETGVLAAAISGDFVSIAHTANGTLTYTINGATSSSTYAATSIYESVVNPDMPAADKANNKKLLAVAAYFVPLTTGQQVVLKARVDSNDKAAWVTLFTKTSASPDTLLTMYESQITQAMGLIDGVNFEFRLESTGGAQITGFAYKYKVLPSNIS
jgi:hypothetical protein